MSDLEKRLREMEGDSPKPVVLHLTNGKTFTHPGPAIEFYAQAMDEIREEKGPLRAALLKTCGSEGCGNICELLQAILFEPGDVLPGGRKT